MSGAENQYLNELKMPEGMSCVEMTLPGLQLFHYVTDDELNRLAEMRKEPVMEICLAATGVFFGSILPAIEQISRFNDSDNPMGVTGLITCGFALVALGVASVTGIIWHIRGGSHRSLLTTIQARQRVKVVTNDNAS